MWEKSEWKLYTCKVCKVWAPPRCSSKSHRQKEGKLSEELLMQTEIKLIALMNKICYQLTSLTPRTASYKASTHQRIEKYTSYLAKKWTLHVVVFSPTTPNSQPMNSFMHQIGLKNNRCKAGLALLTRSQRYVHDGINGTWLWRVQLLIFYPQH